METIVLRNKDIKRAILGVPKGHQHLRLVLEAEEFRLILPEATLANLVRAYIGIKIHPQRRTMELILGKLGIERRAMLSFSCWRPRRRRRE